MNSTVHNVKSLLTMSLRHVGIKEMQTVDFWRGVLGEFVVSAVYIIMVCGGGLSLGNEPSSRLHLAINTGFTVAILASAFWHSSGGHFNPVVSIALFVRRSISLTRCLVYIVSQCIGSVAGAALLYVYTPAQYRRKLGSLTLHPDLSPGIGLLYEITLTYPFMLTVISSTDPIKGFVGFQAPLAIGMSVTICLLSGIPYTGACMNPIRAFGPNVVMNILDHHWVYWLGPLVGTLLACLSYDYIFKLTGTRADVKEDEVSTVSERKRDEACLSV